VDPITSGSGDMPRSGWSNSNTSPACLSTGAAGWLAAQPAHNMINTIATHRLITSTPFFRTLSHSPRIARYGRK
jgi:hypothetical protein